MELPEIPTRVEPVSQGPTQDTAGASGSQTPMASLEVPTHTLYTVPPVANPIPPLAEAAEYPAPPPLGPTVYPEPAAPAPPVPIVYPAPAPAVSVAQFLVPPPTVPPAATTHIDPAVPLVVHTPAYGATPGVPPPVYLVVLPVPPALGISPVPVTIPTHLTDIVATQARISALAELIHNILRGD
ncbi:protein TRACHEARY ELEMENT DIFFERENTIATION-RELATED 7A-like [Zingiber officinale]|uniref:protein TRACHEARY ELEMENT DIFFERENTIATION-RELATED 7A-like n=1 Tax=Zingiber officinale TaxID=94328 RepID=UPI001C4D19CD|nr:protein TRACHEARY ELEMENT DIFFERENTIATION-RELATED 7A-like [Zingiber officinale]